MLNVTVPASRIERLRRGDGEQEHDGCAAREDFTAQLFRVSDRRNNFKKICRARRKKS
jgi:hypothetical protein